MALRSARALSSSAASLVQDCARLRSVCFDSWLAVCFARSMQFSACCRHSPGSPGMAPVLVLQAGDLKLSGTPASLWTRLPVMEINAQQDQSFLTAASAFGAMPY